MQFEEIINKYSSNLTPNDIQILNFIIKNKTYAASLKSKELAKKTYTSPSGLIRLAKRLNFSGFSEMKYFLENETKNTKSSSNKSSEQLQKDIYQTIKSIEQIDLEPLFKKIYSSQHIYIYGTDWGEKIAAQLLVRNFLAQKQNIVFIPSITELKWEVQNLTDNDLVIIISYSGENQELKNLLRVINLKHAYSVSITPISNNFLSSETSLSIYYYMTNLNLRNDNSLEFNYFSPLYLTTDLLFRKFIDSKYVQNSLSSS